MSLNATLQIGKSALAVTQAAIQTTGNNIANAGDANYTRQIARITPGKAMEMQPGLFLGTGVDLQSVERQIDEALQVRLRASISDSEGAALTEQWLGRVEAVFNELTDEDLSSQMSAFFNSWSDLANKPQDTGLRQIVVQNGRNLAQWFNDMHTRFTGLTQDVDQRTAVYADQADQMATKIAQLNAEIVVSEGGAGGAAANSLRDQRDALLSELSGLVNTHTIERENGMIDVYVGSEPLVLGDVTRGVAVKRKVVDGELRQTVVFKEGGASLNARGGALGSVADVRGYIEDTLARTDAIAGNLIHELNKLHGSGQGLQGFDSVTAANGVEDPTAALSDSEATGLDFVPSNGSFVLNVKNRASGTVTSTLIQVDLDGIGTDMSLDDLAAVIDTTADVNASVVGGRLQISADSAAVEVGFADDTSGVLASLGINNFFTGSDAGDIAVAGYLDQPRYLAVAANGETGDNGTARAIAALETQAAAGLGGMSVKEAYDAMVGNVAALARGASADAKAATAVRETMQAQREALSGVSMDEEAANLVRYQRSYQGAARLISAVDEMMQTLLSLV